MLDYVSSMKKDLVEQFRGKRNIEAFVEAIAKQFQDVYDFYEQLLDLRGINTAFGKQLDGAGDIVGLTRREAGELMNNPGEEVDDETYRRLLIYKILKNTCGCTYADIIESIRMFYTDTELSFTESPDEPATMIFDFEGKQDRSEKIISIPFIKASGVDIHFRMNEKFDSQFYAGVGLMDLTRIIVDGAVPEIDPVTFLTDESDVVMKDEARAWLKE